MTLMPKKSTYVIDKKTGQVNAFGQQMNAAMQYANTLNNHYANGGNSSFGGSPMFDPTGMTGMKPITYPGTMTNAGQLGVGGTVGVNSIGGPQVSTQPAGGGGGSNAAISKLMADYAAKYQTARNDNLARYDEGKQGYQDRYARNMALLEGTGQQELADIRSRGDSAKSQSEARLNDLGLGGTTVGASLNAGIDRTTNEALGSAQDRINQRKIQTDAQLSGDTLGFIERRNDAYPELSGYASLIGTLAENGITDLPGVGGGTSGGGPGYDGYVSPANGASMTPAERAKFNNEQRDLTGFLSKQFPTMNGTGTPGTWEHGMMQKLKSYGIEIPGPGQAVTPGWQQEALKKLREIWASGGTVSGGGGKPQGSQKYNNGVISGGSNVGGGIAPRTVKSPYDAYLASLN